MKKTGDVLLAFLIPVLVVIAWHFVTVTGRASSVVLPSINGVWDAFQKSWEQGELQADLYISLVRVLKGYAIAVVLGIVMGSLMGMSELIRKIFHPMITSLRQIPMIAWIPLLILWFGVDEGEKVIVIVIAAFFPISENSFSGISSTPKQLLEVAKIHRMSGWKTLTKIYLPNSLPQMLVGLKLGLSSSWMAVVAAEMIAAAAGIGYRLSESRSLLRPGKVMVCMLVIGIIGIVMDKIVTKIFDCLTPWQIKEGK